jgi:5-deoxy-5-amino-3-dehydroquinate synthase
VVGAFDLATDLPAGRDPEVLLGFMGRDKKAHGDLTFVLDGPRGVEVVRGIDPDDAVATLADMESTGRNAP